MVLWPSSSFTWCSGIPFSIQAAAGLVAQVMKMQIDGAQRRTGRGVQLAVGGPDGFVATRAQHAGLPGLRDPPDGFAELAEDIGARRIRPTCGIGRHHLQHGGQPIGNGNAAIVAVFRIRRAHGEFAARPIEAGLSEAGAVPPCRQPVSIAAMINPWSRWPAPWPMVPAAVSNAISSSSFNRRLRCATLPRLRADSSETGDRARYPFRVAQAKQFLDELDVVVACAHGRDPDAAGHREIP